jgi:cytochrome c-type biogenesis protein CcmE
MMTASDGAVPSTARRARTRRFAIAALAVAAAAFGVITFGGIGKNLVYYWGPAELLAAGPKAVGASIRLGGQVAPDSVKFNSGSNLEFDVRDGKGASVHVKSSGVPPQMFREGIGVVVEGTTTPAGHFECNRLMVSHNNEYRTPTDPKSINMEELIKTTSGIDGSSKKP